MGCLPPAALPLGPASRPLPVDVTKVTSAATAGEDYRSQWANLGKRTEVTRRTCGSFLGMNIDAVTAWSITKAAGEIGQRLYDFGKELKDRDLKQTVDEILDQVRQL